MAEPASPASLLVFADDWGRHPSSCQHLVRQLLGEHRALWVNTIGTRTPRFDRATLRRGAEKLRQWVARPSAASERLPHNLEVINPRMWPWFARSVDRRLNRRMLKRALLPVIERLPQPVVAVTTLPVVADLIGELPVARWVYYCVDDFSLWPGLDSDALRRLDDLLIERADILVAASETLQDRLAAKRPEVRLMTHGVDLAHWHCERSNAVPPAALAGIAGPLVVFWGVVDPRMDVEWLAKLAADLRVGTIVLVGPQNDMPPGLAAIPRLRIVPAVTYDELPAIAQAAAVLVMPYRDLPVTRAMQPLKLKEYLATGRPVVVRDLPSTRPWSDCLDVAATAEEFSSLVRQRIGGTFPESQRTARMRLGEESWEAKARQFADWALSELPTTLPSAPPA